MTRFAYTKLGVARLADNEHGHTSIPIPGNYIWSVTTGTGEYRRVLGLVQEDPSLPNQWRAVASLDPKSYPTVDFARGLWSMHPGRSGFGSKREAAVWLLGMSDALAYAWFGRGIADDA